MTDQERSIHAQVTHLDPHYKESMLRIVQGKYVGKETLASLVSKGWIEHDDYKSITLTQDGNIALRLIHEEM